MSDPKNQSSNLNLEAHGTYTKADILKLLECSNTTLYRMIKTGNFIEPFKINGNSTNRHLRWRRRDVHAWLDAQ